MLEQHHAATTFMIMRKEKSNFLIRMDPSEFQFFRKLVVTNILATDMKEHFEHLNKFEAFCNEIKEKKIDFGIFFNFISHKKTNFFKKKQKKASSHSESQRILLSNTIVHCCDFSGNVKPFKIARIWSERINQEFSRQVLIRLIFSYSFKKKNNYR